MKKSRKEFIKKAHSAACSEWKQNIEKEFPKLFKKDALQVGDWVKTEYGDVFCVRNETVDIFYGYGFCTFEKAWDKYYYADKGLCTLATDKEVAEVLIKEAEKRGFKEGARVDKLLGFNPGSLKGDPKTCGNEEIYLCITKGEEWINRGEKKHYSLFIGSLMIFYKGEWATITETITKEQAEKELGKIIVD